MEMCPCWGHVPAHRASALMGVSIPWCSMGLDPAEDPGAVCGVGAARLFQVGVSLPPRVAPLGQASSLPSVSMPGVQQEDFHCC